MRPLIIFYLFASLVSCSPQDDTTSIPLEIELRKTLEEIQDIPAFLDVEIIEKEGEEIFIFSLEIQGSPQKDRLVPASDLLICSFLNQQLMYGMDIQEDCAKSGYYLRYLSSFPDSPSYRMHVNISGQVKARHSKDLFTGLPLLLEEIKKIESCPVEIIENPNPVALENQFWKLVGFTDMDRNIISFPTCENPNVGIIFHDRILGGVPLEDPLAKSFTIQSAVWTRPGQVFPVYNYLGENTLFITRGVNASYIPPRPATSPTTNFHSLSQDIFNKYDSLSKLFGYFETVEFALKGNKLWLSNPAKDTHALFVFEKSIDD